MGSEGSRCNFLAALDNWLLLGSYYYEDMLYLPVGTFLLGIYCTAPRDSERCIQ